MKTLIFLLLFLPAMAGEEVAYLGMALAKTDSNNSIFVFSLIPGSGAAKAGIKKEDVLIALAGETLHELNDIDRILDDFKPGQTVTVKVKRGRKLIDFQVELSKTPSVTERLTPIIGEQVAGIFSMGRYWFGFEGVEISKDSAAKLKAPQGILVNKVFGEGPARDAELMAGDVVFSVEGESLTTLLDLGRKLAAFKEGSHVEMEFIRDGVRKKVPFRLVSLGDVPDAYRKDLQNYLNFNKLIQGAIEFGEKIQLDLEDEEQ